MPDSWKRGEPLGAGSFGTVYLGLNNDTGGAQGIHVMMFAQICLGFLVESAFLWSQGSF